MTNNEFIQGALRTDVNYDDPKLQARMSDIVAIGQMLRHLQMVEIAGRNLDVVKKFLYYGKLLPPTPGADPDSVHGKVGPDLFKRLQENAQLLHSVIGLTTELSEIIQALTLALNGSPLPRVNLIEEGGDMFWYMALYVSALNSSFEDLEERNNRKLRVRYPDKFNAECALTRDLDAELKVLSVQQAPMDGSPHGTTSTMEIGRAEKANWPDPTPEMLENQEQAEASLGVEVVGAPIPPHVFRMCNTYLGKAGLLEDGEFVSGIVRYPGKNKIEFQLDRK